MGEFADDRADKMLADDRHIRILSDILKESSNAAPFCNILSIEEELRKVVAKSGKLEFDLNLIPLLINQMIPLKHRLLDYVTELRNLVLA